MRGRSLALDAYNLPLLDKATCKFTGRNESFGTFSLSLTRLCCRRTYRILATPLPHFAHTGSDDLLNEELCCSKDRTPGGTLSSEEKNFGVVFLFPALCDKKV